MCSSQLTDRTCRSMPRNRAGAAPHAGDDHPARGDQGDPDDDAGGFEGVAYSPEGRAIWDAEMEGARQERTERPSPQRRSGRQARRGRRRGHHDLPVAAEVGVDVIVVGSHGRTGVKRLFLGSVSEHVVRHAPCPVLVVREEPEGREGEVARRLVGSRSGVAGPGHAVALAVGVARRTGRAAGCRAGEPDGRSGRPRRARRARAGRGSRRSRRGSRS